MSVVLTSNEKSKIEECRDAFEKYLGPRAQLTRVNGYYMASLVERAWGDFQAGWLAAHAHETNSCGIKCSHCDGKGRQESYYDEDSGWMEEIPCETCGGSGRITTVEQYLKTLPADWHEDSSLQTWFPLTAESLERQEHLIDALVPFTIKGETSIQDVYNARKALGLEPYDDLAAEGLVNRSISRSQKASEHPPGDCNRRGLPGEPCDRNCNWPECGCVCGDDGVMRPSQGK